MSSDVEDDDQWRKYGRDHGVRITMGELVDLVMDSFKKGDEAFIAALDREFLIGCWGHALSYQQDRNLLRDLRGFILSAVRAAYVMGKRGEVRRNEATEVPTPLDEKYPGL